MKKKQCFYVLFIIAVMGMLLIPFALKPGFGSGFEEDFAFRDAFITAGSWVKSHLFHTSSQDNVVVGREGYLFYGSSLKDYLGLDVLTDKKTDNIVSNLERLQDNLESRGIQFVFAIAPNKNSLYGEYMPDVYQKLKKGDGTREKLTALLKKRDVNYVDLYELFEKEKNVFYHRTDSHWNNAGAAMVCENLLGALGKECTDYAGVKTEIKNDFEGDLFRMLYPAAVGTEEEIYYQKTWNYTFDREIKSLFDLQIETSNQKKKGSVVVFRDSFGNSMLPFVADEYGKALFSRSMPIEAERAVERNANHVIMEIVERNLELLQTEAPVVISRQMKNLSVPDFVLPEYNGNVTVENGSRIHIQGNLDRAQSSVSMDTYVRLYQRESRKAFLYETFRQEGSRGDGYGFSAYLDSEELPEGTYEISLVNDERGAMSRTPVLAEVSVKSSADTGNTKKNRKHTADSDGAAVSGLAEAENMVGRDIDDLIAVVGEPLDYMTAASCESSGEDGQYQFEGFTVYTQSEERGGTQIIKEVLKEYK